MKSRVLSRRTVLRGAGGLAVALPMLEAMAPRRAAAAAPKRFVIFFTPNGTNNQKLFVPATTGTGFTLPEETAPLMPVKDKLLVLSNITGKTALADEHVVGDQHANGMGHMLTCMPCVKGPKVGDVPDWGGGISIDQQMAQLLKPPTKFPTLELGVQSILGRGAHPFTRMVYKGPADPIPAQDDPAMVWSRLFSDLSTAPPTGAPVVDQAREQRKSILDFVRQDYSRLATTLGAKDKAKMDAHATFMREIELRLGMPTGVPSGCGKPEQPPALNISDPKQFPAIAKLQMDMLALALSCDLTRIASLQMSWARSDVAMSWIGVNLSHHDMSHDQKQPNAPLSNVNKWYSEQVLYFVKALDALKEDGGATSVLDNSVVWWCSDISFGPLHSFTNLRVFLFGSCGGYFKTGQHVATSNTTDNQLMVTFLQAMGANTNQFGHSSVAPGPITNPAIKA